MSTGKPAALDGSLLARKGDAAPAIPNTSPLLEELGEPRGETPGGPYGTGPASGGKSPMAVISRGLAWFSRHPMYGILMFAVGIAILFAVTIVALTPSEEAVAPAPMPKSESTALAPAKLDPPSGSDSLTQPSEETATSAVKEPPPSVASPEPSLPVAPPEPPKPASAAPAISATPAKKPVPKPAVKPPAPTKPAAAARSTASAPPAGNTGRYLLQLSAVPTAKAARSELARLTKRLGGVLGNRKIIVVKAVPPGKLPVYRLRASSYDTRSAAGAACREIRKRKMGCIVVRR